MAVEFRLKAYQHWLTMQEPQWPNVTYEKIDFQDIIYYSATKRKKLKSLDEVHRSFCARSRSSVSR